MMPVTLQAIPNQRVQFYADNQSYDITLQTIDDTVHMDVTMNGNVLITSQPCLFEQQVIPYNYLEGAGGNFLFTTASGDNPQYVNFGSSDVLLYVTNAELASARGA